LGREASFAGGYGAAWRVGKRAKLRFKIGWSEN
jgi:hypothetical protein